MQVRDALDRLEQIHDHLSRAEVYRGFRVPAVAGVGALAVAAAAAQHTVPAAAEGVGFVWFWVAVAAIGALTGTAAVCVAVGCLIAVPRAPFGPQMLVHSAIANGAALLVAALAAAVLLRFVAGDVVAKGVPLRVVAAIALTVALGTRLPWLGKLFVPVEAAGLGLVYLALLALFGELGRADLATLKQAFGRRKRA